MYWSNVAENHKLANCNNCSLNCCAWCERSVTLSTISWMAAVFGQFRAAVLVAATTVFNKSHSTLLEFITLLATSGAEACLDRVSPMKTSLWALRMTNLLCATKMRGGCPVLTQPKKASTALRSVTKCCSHCSEQNVSSWRSRAQTGVEGDREEDESEGEAEVMPECWCEIHCEMSFSTGLITSCSSFLN